MTTDKSKRQEEILKLFKNIVSVSLSAEKYFINNETPISLSQYYRLKKRFNQHFITGIEDNRTAGNAKKLSPQQVELVHVVLMYNRHLTSKSLQCELQSSLGIELDTTRIDQLRRQFNLPRLELKTQILQPVEFAGIEILEA